MDYLTDDPPINRITPDHFKSMIAALKKLTELDYKRPSLVLQRRSAERLMFWWEAAFDAFWSHCNDGAITDHFIFDDLNREDFVEWLHATESDVVTCHRIETLDWMREVGYRRRMVSAV